MLLRRSRAKRFPTDRRNLDRWWRRNRSRAEELAEHVSEDVIPDLAERIEHLREEAAPLVSAAMTERAPRRRRSRKAKGARIGVAFLLLAAIALVAYLIWQRRDREPAYLTQEPDEPLATPGEPDPGGAEEPSPSEPPVAEREAANGRDAEVAAGPFRPEPEPEPAREGEREPARSAASWTPVNFEAPPRPVEQPARSPEARSRAPELPSAAPRAPQGAPTGNREQLPRVTIRPNLPR